MALTRDARDVIFGLPSAVFGPVSSPARRGYARILLRLHRDHLEKEVAGLNLRRADVVGVISGIMDRESDVRDEFAADSANAQVSSNPSQVYRQLVEAGWFDEFPVGTETMVTMPRSVSLLLAALDGIDRGSTVNFTGSLQSVEASLRMLGERPSENAMLLVMMVRQAEEFSTATRIVLEDISASERLIARQSSLGEMVEAFFTEFVSRLVSDYRALKGRFNPLRHAHAIVVQAKGFSGDEAFLSALAASYVEFGQAVDAAEASVLVADHLDRVAAVFSKVGGIVDRIDDVRMRIEDRVARALRYMDAARIAEIALVEQALSEIGRLHDEMELPPSALMLDDRPIDEDSLSSPSVMRERVIRSTVRRAEDDPALRLLTEERNAHADAMTVTPDRIAAYLDRQMAALGSLSLSDFLVDDPAEMILLAAVRSLDTVDDAGLRARFDVEMAKGEWVDGLWSEFPAGTVHRAGSGFVPVAVKPLVSVVDPPSGSVRDDLVA